MRTLEGLIRQIQLQDSQYSKVRRSGKIIWCPSFKNDFSILTSILVSNLYLSPTIFFLSDESEINTVLNEKIEIIERKEIQIEEDTELLISSCTYLKIKRNDFDLISIYVFPKLDSEKMLKYLIDKKLEINYLYINQIKNANIKLDFIQASQSLNYKYLIIDLGMHSSEKNALTVDKMEKQYDLALVDSGFGKSMNSNRFYIFENIKHSVQ